MSAPAGFRFAFEDVDEPPDGQCWMIHVYESVGGERWAERWPITRRAARQWRYSPFRGGRRE